MIFLSIFVITFIWITESHVLPIVSLNSDSRHPANDNKKVRSTLSKNIITASNRLPLVILENNLSSKPTQHIIETSIVDLSTQKWSRKYRLDFVKKVYSIFTVQTLSTIVITSIIMRNPSISSFLRINLKFVTLCSAVSSILAALALVLSPRCRYSSPLNFILLGIFTFFQSVTVGTFSSLFNTRTVCLGSMHTLSALLAITIYAFQPNPKYDLSASGNILLAALATLTTGTILNFFFRMPMVDNLLSGLLAVVFAGYIAHDTQMIVGGKSKRQYSTDDYILAALNLYQDAISLYMQIMKLLTKDKND